MPVMHSFTSGMVPVQKATTYTSMYPYTFTVESYLCDKDSDVYKAVQNLKVGDVVDMEGFLYWYEGVNPHITSVSVQ